MADLVRRDVASNVVARQARAWRLLGFSDAVGPVADLWSELDDLRPRSGWLAEIATVSQGAYDRNLWARHWYEQLTNATTSAQAYAAFRLLLHSVDHRISGWINWSKMEAAPFHRSLEAFWIMNRLALQKRLDDRNKETNKRLFGMNIMKQTQSPWL